MFLLTSQEMKRIDAIAVNDFNIPERVLMENAGRAAATYFLELFYSNLQKNVAIVAGKGNNGGDSFVMARYLSQKNFFVTVFLLSKKEQVKTRASRENLSLLSKLGVSVIEVYNEELLRDLMSKTILSKYNILVDAIFGIGLNYSIEGHYKTAINFLNTSKKPIFSLDIPSGIDSDSGQIFGVCICAYATVTFALPKVGLFVYPGSDFIGKLRIMDIGIPFTVFEKVKCKTKILHFKTLERGFVLRKSDCHKGTSGHLVIVAGSLGKVGAAVMSSLGAMRSGAGLVTLCIPKTLNSIVESILIEVMTCGLPDNSLGTINRLAYDLIAPLLNNKKCVIFGPGTGICSDTFIVLQQLIENCSLPMVIDADGISILSKSLSMLKKKKAPIILTPHPGEMARLTNLSISEVNKSRVSLARKFAHEFNVYVVLKGKGTVIATPDKEIYINTTGNPGMASAGMGDVLTGMIASFITQGYDIKFALKFAVYVHSMAADFLASHKGIYGYLATDLANCIPEQISRIHRKERELLSYKIFI